MRKVVVETVIGIPVPACFDLARDIDVHCRSAADTHERAVAGVATGLIGPGETVTFEAVHFGIRQRLTAKITEYDRPHRFVDEMAQGAFKRLRHTHEFESAETGTLMRDTIEWEAPLGWIGRIADRLFLERHMQRFLERKNQKLKEIAERRPA